MLIECSNIKKSFQGIPLLKDITFKVDNHDKIAIIGVNGAGKTTILKIIYEELSLNILNIVPFSSVISIKFNINDFQIGFILLFIKKI